MRKLGMCLDCYLLGYDAMQKSSTLMMETASLSKNSDNGLQHSAMSEPRTQSKPSLPWKPQISEEYGFEAH
jgi:hypothetical protein